jgi:hypothetical protein
MVDVASLDLFKWTEYIIRCSMFNVRCSMFISFFFDLTGRSRPAATLNTDT